MVHELPIFLLAAGTLVGAAAGGTIGYAAAGLTGAGIGIGVGALAGFGLGATAYALSRPVVMYPLPVPYYYGPHYYPPAAYPGYPVYYRTA
jgi:hypothetical protein